MAMTPEQIKGLDQLRLRLSQLSTSISSLRANLESTNPLPDWETLQSTAQALSLNLEQLNTTFQTHAQFLREAHAYPLTSFPGHQQGAEDILGQLLRKKLEPRVEDWIAENTSKPEAGQVNGAGKQGSKLQEEEMRELWDWSLGESRQILAGLQDEEVFDDNFTIAEREAGIENVVTGIRRNLDRGSDDEDEDDDMDENEDDDKMEDVMPEANVQGNGEQGVDSSLPPVPLESVLRFMSTGALPNGVRVNR